MGMTQGVVENLSSMTKSVLDFSDAKKEKKLAKREAELNKQELLKKQELYTKSKKNLLDAKLASKKALMAANGVNFTDGSSAVLVGQMEKETDEEIANNDYFTDLDLKSNQIKYNYKKNKSLLRQRKSLIDATNSGLKLI